MIRRTARLASALALWACAAMAQRPQGGLPGQQPGQQPGRVDPDQLLREFDADHDGRISRDEAPDRMRQRWDPIDTNRDGFITLDELQAREARVGRMESQAARGAAGGRRGDAARVQAAGPFSVITVGTGSPRYDPERSGPSALIQYRGRYVLVDMGNGTQARLSEAGILPTQLDALLLTHHHLDHNEEFIPLFIHTRLAGGKPELVGPPGTAALADFILSFYKEDIAYRLARSGRTMADFAPSAPREVKGGESFALGGMQVRAAQVNHSIYTVAYRFDADGQSIVISGDLAYSDSLVELARGADVLVMDSGGAIVRQGEAGHAGPGAAGPAAGERVGDDAHMQAHSSAKDVATMAEKAGARRLVLTHIAPGEVDEDATVRAVGAFYHGEVIVGHDLLEITPGAAAGRAAPAAATAGAKSAGRARVFVSAAASAGARPDGRSWATAFSTIQAGLDAALEQGGGEVWAARGTYKPAADSDRSASFQLRKGVALYGGFAGTETQRDQRDWVQNATVLSGDIGREGVKTDNAYRVVTGAADAVLDGFTVTGGYALDAGGPGQGNARRGGPSPQGQPGMPPIHISPDLVLQGGGAGSGAGMSNFQCAPTVRNCVFKDNSAGKGGAMYNMVSVSFPPRRDAAAPAPLVEDCRFVGNYARGRGGAVANDLGTHATFRGCVFLDNACDGKGGAMYDDFGCSPVLANCLFVRNRAVSAGAVGNDGASSPLIVHCTFTRNAAQEEGAALYQGTGPANSPAVVGSILWDNRCANGPAEIFNWHDDDPQVTASCVQGGWPGEGNADRDPRFVDPAHDDFRLRPDSPCKGAGYTAATSDELLKQSDRRTSLPPMPRRLEGDAQPRAAAAAATPAVILRVNAARAAGPADGASWAAAFPSLQDALAASGDRRAELWVAAGTYKPGSGGDRAATFQLRQGLELYGGFRGSETERAQRDWTANATILSGDLGRAGEAEDNAYHVLIGADGAVLDGFVVCDGNADGRTYDGKGGGMINYRRGPQSGPMSEPAGYSPVVRNCLFTHNRALEGGAVYSYDRGAPQFAACRFIANSADYGGAMVDRVGVKSVLTDCVFENNAARWRAGALYLDYGARPRLTGCRFAGNRSDCHGGAVATISRASQLENTIAVLRNCAFSGNSAKRRGGAIANFDTGIVGLDGCAFTDNAAGAAGGAVSNDERARAVVLDCRFSGNKAGQGEADVAADETSSVSRSRADWPNPDAAQPAQRRFGPPDGARSGGEPPAGAGGRGFGPP